MQQPRDLPQFLTLEDRARTLSAAITSRLREAIFSGELQPRTLLSQESLAEKFGVSRVPIREALKQLSTEGLVTLHSHRTAFVTALSLEEIDELLAIAGTLDALATRRGVPKLSDADLNEMDRLLNAMKAAEDRPTEWFALNVAFHLIPTRASGWKRLEQLVVESRKNVSRYAVDRQLFDAEVPRWHDQHTRFFQACKGRHVAEAQELADQHWRYSTRVIHESEKLRSERQLAATIPNATARKA